ncbi:hypothetical protein KP509_24G036200 [Ceratopteris richardii]|nr:hypothetical protein KP509_24G036200 [Ceratopteris richardii]
MRPASTGSIRTPWDVIEDDEAYHIRVDMPGFSKEDVKVRVENASLVVTGERDPSKEDERWASKSYSKFKTRLSLPDDAHSEKITAEMRNGVLCLAIPKLKPEEKHHVINVEIV